MNNKKLATFALICFSFFIFSCGGLRVAENRNFKNTKEIGVEWSVDGVVKNVGDNYEQTVDSLMELAMATYNQQHPQLVFRKKQKKDKDYITVSIDRFKVVKAGGKAAGYVVTGVGLIAAPITVLVLSEYTFALAFYYWPAHKMTGTAELSSALASDKGYRTFMGAEKGALFGTNKKQIPKLYSRYVESMHKVFAMVETRLAENGSKSQ